MKDPRLNIPGEYIKHGAIAFPPKNNINKELEALRKEVEENNKIVNQLLQLFQQQLQTSTKLPTED
jgi:hypothetical protein